MTTPTALPPDATQVHPDRFRLPASDLATLRQKLQALPPAQAHHVQEILWLDMRQRWQQGQGLFAEAYLPLALEFAIPPEGQVDLIYGEFCLRTMAGEHPSVQEYLGRFPQHQTALQRQFEVEAALASSLGDDLCETGVDGQQPDKPAPRKAADATFPEQIGNYRVIAPLARQGAQAQVFRAVHPVLGRDVVLKVSRAVGNWGVGDRNRLVEEGRILAAVQHPHLVPIFDLGWEGDHAYLVMEYVRGQTLDQYARQRRLTGAEIARLLAGVARALAAVHSQGVLHQDIKPSNILVDDQGQARLLDFGLAQWRHAWQEQDEPECLVGTVAFMPPEMARGELPRVGPHSDLFGLGAVLYYLLTGQPPYRGRPPVEILPLAQQGAWQEPAVISGDATTRRLWTLCRRLLAFDPAQRPGSAAEVAAALETVAQPSRVVRNSLLLGAGSSVVLLLVAVLLLAKTQREPSTTATPPRGPAPVPTASQELLSLQVRAWRGKEGGDLLNLVPLRPGDQVRVEAKVPAGCHATLFLLTSQGQYRELAVQTQDAALRFPPEQEKSSPVQGAEGTEVWLLCVRRSQPVHVTELASWLPPERLPAMPGETVLELRPEGLEVLQRSKDVGTPQLRTDGEGQVIYRLKEWQKRLQGHVEDYRAVVFSLEN
jgi:serine/threonine protein kinase